MKCIGSSLRNRCRSSEETVFDILGDISTVWVGTAGAVTIVDGFLVGSFAGGRGGGKSTDDFGTVDSCESIDGVSVFNPF